VIVGSAEEKGEESRRNVGGDAGEGGRSFVLVGSAEERGKKVDEM